MVIDYINWMKKLNLNILIVDDDNYFRMGLKSVLGNYGLITEAANVSEATSLIDANHYDLALIDMQMEEETSGLTVLKKAKAKGINSIILSSYDDEDVTEMAYEYGCDHFLAKLHYSTHLESYIINFIKNHKLNILDDFFTNKYITQDQKLIQDITQIAKMNTKDKSIFISGETGVGKSLIGKLIHEFSHKDDAPFIHLNCSEISENLIESELFGCKKGAYTGATQDRKGKLELANNGTLFLDEIATMSITMQMKLLKAIDEKTFYPVGGEKVVRSNFTLITATCEDLFEKVHKGEFRKDLFFRLSGINLEIPSLKERKEDILPLIKYFMSISHRRFVIKADAKTLLNNYDWPGNIRELKKVIETLSLSPHGLISVSELPKHLNKSNSTFAYADSWLTSNQKEFIGRHGLRSFIKRIEKETVSETLEKYNNKITQAIKELKISSSAFYRIKDEVSL